MPCESWLRVPKWKRAIACVVIGGGVAGGIALHNEIPLLGPKGGQPLHFEVVVHKSG